MQNGGFGLQGGQQQIAHRRAFFEFLRVAAWLAEAPQARTRTSAFARLAPVAT
jgi:hypothetical protein